MNLHRLGPLMTEPWMIQKEGTARPGRPDPLDSLVEYQFHKFGNGGLRHSHFNVYVYWSDVENLISQFQEMGYPEALQLARERETLQQVRALVAPPPTSTSVPAKRRRKRKPRKRQRL